MRQLHTAETAAQWLRERVTGTIHTDSRKLRAGDGFIAWPGAATDARQHVVAALAGGATACLVELSGVERFDFAGDNVAAYTGLKAASGLIAANFFEQASEKLDVLAVTGTNGKTSTAWWLAQALSNLKQVAPVPCAMIGTLGIGMPPAPGSASGTQVESLLATGLTTPDPVLLQQSFHRFLVQGLKACAIEVSSIGIEEDRLAGTRVRTAILTNFTQDHLDYHGSMEAYWQAKAKLFAWPGLQSAVLNVDDERGAALALSIEGRVPDLWTISCAVPARLRASDIHYDQQGLRFVVVEAGGPERHTVQTRLIGTYNVYNLLGVMAAMRSIGVPLAAIVATCADLSAVPGRMECVGATGQTLVAVDYAHTPDALSKALTALRSLADQRGGQLWCVFGCGGDRDTVKRPLMGAMASCHADRVVVTSDNPRSEKPEVIISQILLGLTGHGAVTVEPDRAQAIAYAMSLASASDVVLIAGKGHEDYQEVAGTRLPFSDMDQVRQALRSKGASAHQIGGAI
jgi:UDP-N-acetylmuramyl-tripeptide synthetase